jgi:catechol 2,3-dioxygenase-like lactoylglutathione lyase family enzyme
MSAALPPRMTFVTLGARDVPKLRAFYERLGFPLAIADGDTFASFVVGGVILALFQRDLLREEAEAGDLPDAGWSGVSLAINVDEKEQVDAAYEAAVAAGATPIYAPRDRPYGPRSGYVADPEGNRWEIAWAPGIAFDARGAVTKFGD